MHLLVSVYFKVKVLFEAIILTVYTCTANVHSQNTRRLVLSCTVVVELHHIVTNCFSSSNCVTISLADGLAHINKNQPLFRLLSHKKKYEYPKTRNSL